MYLWKDNTSKHCRRKYLKTVGKLLYFTLNREVGAPLNNMEALVVKYRYTVLKVKFKSTNLCQRSFERDQPLLRYSFATSSIIFPPKFVWIWQCHAWYKLLSNITQDIHVHVYCSHILVYCTLISSPLTVCHPVCHVHALTPQSYPLE